MSFTALVYFARTELNMRFDDAIKFAAEMCNL